MELIPQREYFILARVPRRKLRIEELRRSLPKISF